MGMLSLLLGPFYQSMRTLAAQKETARLMQLKAFSKEAFEDLVKEIRIDLVSLVSILTKLHLVESANFAKRAIAKIDQKVTVEELHFILEHLREIIHSEGASRYVYHLDPQKAQVTFLTGENPWSAILARFPKIGPDVNSAVRCYALDQNTACVFHLMRVMEFGVQEFAKHLKVSLISKNTKKFHELTWHQILDALNPKLRSMLPNTKAKKEKFEMLCAIQAQLYSVKDAWRNPTMHPQRSRYGDRETSELINLVQAFLSRLASLKP